MSRFFKVTKGSTLLLSCLTLSACSSPGRPQASSAGQTTATLSSSEDPNVIYGVADVESVEAQIVSTSPMRGKVVVRGLLSDGATSIHKVEQTRVTGGFVISISTARDRAAMATLALVPFEREILLDLSSNASGSCYIRVNGKSTTLLIP